MTEPADPVLGVDGCRGGWVGVLLRPDGSTSIHCAPAIDRLVSRVREDAAPRVVAIDIPIGLPDRGVRQADVLARRELGGRAASVFTTLTRAAYEASTYADARAANVAATGGRSASAQAYALREKILDVDGWIRSTTAPGDHQLEVIEVHPELSFARMAGAVIQPSKKSPDGVRGRRNALRRAGIRPPARSTGSGFGEDDLLDACAVAWTARRHARGESQGIPSTPELFGDGIPAAIRV